MKTFSCLLLLLFVFSFFGEAKADIPPDLHEVGIDYSTFYVDCEEQPLELEIVAEDEANVDDIPFSTYDIYLEYCKKHNLPLPCPEASASIALEQIH